ncbi:MAG: hypothetical protein ACLTG4_02185 [Oscillospiraceae bacterium]
MREETGLRLTAITHVLPGGVHGRHRR